MIVYRKILVFGLKHVSPHKFEKRIKVNSGTMNSPEQSGWKTKLSEVDKRLRYVTWVDMSSFSVFILRICKFHIWYFNGFVNDYSFSYYNMKSLQKLLVLWFYYFSYLWSVIQFRYVTYIYISRPNSRDIIRQFHLLPLSLVKW